MIINAPKTPPGNPPNHQTAKPPNSQPSLDAQTLGHIMIINAPAVFRMLWGMVRGLLDARTQSKIEASTVASAGAGPLPCAE